MSVTANPIGSDSERSRPVRSWRAGLAGALAGSLIAGSAGIWSARGPAVSAAPGSATPPAVEAATTNRVDSYADLVQRVAPAVVTIRSQRNVQQTGMGGQEEELLRRFFRFGPDQMPTPRREGGLGSGVIVRQDGYILTNHHVIDGSTRVQVDLVDGRSLDAQVVGSDAPSDLAVLKVEAAGLLTLPLANSDSTRVGDVVLAIGNPLGVGQTVTTGIISAKGRATTGGNDSYEDFLQTDAPINRGNSGGALINMRGELVGINSQILSPSGFNIGIGFAIPSNMASNVLDQLIETGSVRRGLLGVTVQGVTADLARSLGLKEVRGAIVNNVTPNSAASRAGVKQGDVILSLDGKPVDSSNALRNQVARLKPGTSVALEVLRDSQERELSVSLGELPSDTKATRSNGSSQGGGKYGLSVEPLTRERARELEIESTSGLVVASVDPNGPGAEAGLQAGDVIEQVNRKPVTTVEELRAGLDAGTSEKPALVLVNRGGNHLFLTVEPAE